MEGRAVQLLAISAVFLALAWLFVTLRVIVRALIVRSFGMDDWLILASLGILTVHCAFEITGVHYGVGSHIVDLEPANIGLALKFQTLCEATYILDTMFIKLSVGFLLLRIPSDNKTRYRRIIYASMVILSIWTIVTFFLVVFQCVPVRRTWDKLVPGHCMSIQGVTNIGYAFSATDILFDWLFALIPIPMLWDVKMTTQLKVSILIVLGMGIVASTATLVRLKYILDLKDPSDILYTFAETLIWTVAEIGIGICTASVATLRPLFKYLRIRGFSAHPSSGPHYPRSYGLGYIPTGDWPPKTRTGASQTSARDENTSQESILEGGLRIKQTMDVEIRYEGGRG